MDWLKNKEVKQEGGFTQIPILIKYLSILNNSDQQERWLFIFSDLETTNRNRKKTRLPPNEVVDLRNTHVRILYVPFISYSEWQAMEKSWRNWFLKSGAKSFALYDPASSRTLKNLLPQSFSIPRSLKPFN